MLLWVYYYLWILVLGPPKHVSIFRISLSEVNLLCPQEPAILGYPQTLHMNYNASLVHVVIIY